MLINCIYIYTITENKFLKTDKTYPIDKKIDVWQLPRHLCKHNPLKRRYVLNENGIRNMVAKVLEPMLTIDIFCYRM